jgi:hypothetical protein
MGTRNYKPKTGDLVVFRVVPPGLLDGLMRVDQRAISAVVGKPIVLSSYDDFGSAELHFTDRRGFGALQDLPTYTLQK